MKNELNRAGSFAGIAGIALIMSALVACGGSDGTSSASAGGSQATTETSTSAAPASASTDSTATTAGATSTGTTTTTPATAATTTESPATASTTAATTAAPAATAVASTPTAETVAAQAEATAQVSVTSAPAIPTGAAPVSAKYSLNTIDTVIADMTLPSDFSPPGYANGFATLNSATPLVTPLYRLAGMAMDAITGWLVIGRGPADQSYNTRVEARNQKLYVLYSNGYWAQVISGRPAGRRRLNSPFMDVGGGDEFAVDYATSSINAPVGFLHEMWAGVAAVPNWYSVIGFFATAEVRQVVANYGLPDDRVYARWSAQMGCDWMNYASFASNPTDISTRSPCGSGRFKQVTNDWQPVNFISMKGWMTSNLGSFEDPSWQVQNPYQWVRDGNHPLGVALGEWYVRANPPPL